MKNDFWLQRWQNKEIGWHKQDFHPQLVKLGKEVFASGSAVFVPLCGKSKDMLWLAEEGYSVIGCELSVIAIEEFFAEINLQYTIHKEGAFNCYTAGPYTLYQGDFFELEKDYLSKCSGWYDRASLIAFPDEMRADYVAKLLQLFAVGSRALIISLSYNEGFRKGPPFSVSVDKVKGYFNNATELELLSTTATSLSGVQTPSEQQHNGNVEEHVFTLTL